MDARWFPEILPGELEPSRSSRPLLGVEKWPFVGTYQMGRHRYYYRFKAAPNKLLESTET